MYQKKKDNNGHIDGINFWNNHNFIDCDFIFYLIPKKEWILQLL